MRFELWKLMKQAWTSLFDITFARQISQKKNLSGEIRNYRYLLKVRTLKWGTYKRWEDCRYYSTILSLLKLFDNIAAFITLFLREDSHLSLICLVLVQNTYQRIWISEYLSSKFKFTAITSLAINKCYWSNMALQYFQRNVTYKRSSVMILT